jgi:cellulose synthase operon protein C
MRVACPHCRAAYKVDDGRVPARGINVRCAKCRKPFPVRPPDASEPAAAPMPQPGIAAPPSAGAIPLPPPSTAPLSHDAPPVLSPPAPPAASPAPASRAAIPLPPPALPTQGRFATLEPPVVPPAPPAPFDAEGFAESEPFPVEATPAGGVAPGGPGDPVVDAPSGGSMDPAEPLGFGEVEFEPASPPPSAPPPFAAARPPEQPTGAEELEMLFGEGARPTPAAAPAAYKVRRRSGKVFGPFDEAQVVEMLEKGELMGNEDVSSDGGRAWTAIGAVAAFGEALRKLSADAAAPASAAAPQRSIAFGDRALAVPAAKAGRTSPRRRTRLLVPIALVVVLAAAAGYGATFTPYGVLLTGALRPAGDSARAAALLQQARWALAQNDLVSERAALELATQAIAADPRGGGAAALHAGVVAALEQRHAAPPEALDHARRNAERLEREERGEVNALAARLAVTLATAPGAATAPHEAALELAAQKAPPDAELLVLLARAALARGDTARAAALYRRVEAIAPASLRAAHGAGLAAAAGGDAAGARAAFARALEIDPAHLATRLELAVIAAGEGDVARAEAELAHLLAEEAAARLGPAERGRALVARAALLGRSAAAADEADRLLETAVAADPRLLEARIALARHRLGRADAPGAVAALDEVAQRAAANPALAAIRIRALALAGRAFDASNLAEQALLQAPGDPGLLVAKGAVLESSSKIDEALAMYRGAAARDPRAFEPRLAAGRIALSQGDLATAASEVDAALERGPREPAAHAALGELRAAQGDAAGAEKAYRAALALDAEYSPAEVGLARLAARRGDARGARARLERALAVDTRNVEGHVAYGTLLWEAKELESAERAFQTAVEIRPRHAVALARAGAVKLERGEDVDGAVQRLTAASNEDPRFAEARRWLGRALLRKGETPGAITQLRKAVELEPTNPENPLHLGVALERSGALVEAVEAYRGATALDPRFVEAHERIGTLFAVNGRCDEAIPAFERAIAAAPRASRLRLALGDCKAKLRKHEEAAKVFREVLRTDPGAVQALYRLARAVHEAEGPRAALAWYERAAREDAANPMPHYYLGYLYKERGQRAKAVQEFRRYLALRPEAGERRDIELEIEDLGGARD